MVDKKMVRNVVARIVIKINFTIFDKVLLIKKIIYEITK